LTDPAYQRLSLARAIVLVVGLACLGCTSPSHATPVASAPDGLRSAVGSEQTLVASPSSVPATSPPASGDFAASGLDFVPAPLDVRIATSLIVAEVEVERIEAAVPVLDSPSAPEGAAASGAARIARLKVMRLFQGFDRTTTILTLLPPEGSIHHTVAPDANGTAAGDDIGLAAGDRAISLLAGWPSDGLPGAADCRQRAMSENARNSWVGAHAECAVGTHFLVEGDMAHDPVHGDTMPLADLVALIETVLHPEDVLDVRQIVPFSYKVVDRIYLGPVHAAQLSRVMFEARVEKVHAPQFNTVSGARPAHAPDDSDPEVDRDNWDIRENVELVVTRAYSDAEVGETLVTAQPYQPDNPYSPTSGAFEPQLLEGSTVLIMARPYDDYWAEHEADTFWHGRAQALVDELGRSHPSVRYLSFFTFVSSYRYEGTYAAGAIGVTTVSHIRKSVVDALGPPTPSTAGPP